MKYDNYLSSGFSHAATRQDPRRGFSELRLYNPTPERSEATMTVYYVDREPYTLPQIAVLPADHTRYNDMPSMNSAAFTNCGFWGAKIESTTPLMVIRIDVNQYLPEKPHFRGGATNFHGTKLSSEWHFPNGLWVDWGKYYEGDLGRVSARFNEMEYYHFLNPNPRPANVAMTLLYQRREPVMVRLVVPAERVLVWDNREKVANNEAYAVKVVSSEPISSSGVRYIYGLHGLEEWGARIRCHRFAVPGPIVE